MKLYKKKVLEDLVLIGACADARFELERDPRSVRAIWRNWYDLWVRAAGDIKSVYAQWLLTALTDYLPQKFCEGCWCGSCRRKLTPPTPEQVYRALELRAREHRRGG